MNVPFRISLPLTAASLVPLAGAQVAYGTDAPSDDENFLLEVASTVSSGPLFTGEEMFGLADDDTNLLLYLSEEGRVSAWGYGDPGSPSTVVQVSDPVSGNFIRCEALAHIGGVLFGVDEFGGPGEEGIYSIDLVTGDGTAVHIYGNVDLDIGGLDADPTTGLFYGTSDAAAARGVTELDTALLTETILSPYPGALSDIDGVAVDPAGAVYLIQDEPQPIDVFDLSTLTYTGTVPSAVAGARVFSAGSWSDVLTPGTVIGTNYCTAIPNSTGSPGVISAVGSDVAVFNDVTLRASSLPTNATLFFITSTTQAFVPNHNGSAGNLCVASAIGRFVGAGQVLNTGASGSAVLALDLTMIPTSTGFVTITAGETHHYQAWHRDSNAGTPVSNFTDGLSITYN